MDKFVRKDGKDPFINTPNDATPALFGHLNAVVKEVNNSSSSYKVCTALLNQTGTDAPVATVLENTLDFDITWSRADVGIYTSNNFSSSYVVTITGGTSDESSIVNYSISNAGMNKYFSIKTFGRISTDLADGKIVNMLVEIRVYP